MMTGKLIRQVLKWFAVICLLPVFLWTFGAIWYSNLPWAWMRHWSAVVYILLVVAGLIAYRRKPVLAAVGIGVLTLGVVIWWLLIPATNDRNWKPQFARMPKATFNGSKIKLENIRDFIYRSETDFTPRYIDGVYDLDQVRTVDLGLCYWDGNTAIAHLMLSFGFADGRHLVFSNETRLAVGQQQGAVEGLFKQYGILFIIGTEDDLFKLRTNYRHEQLYLYPTNSPPQDVRKILVSLLERCNRMIERPEFYNTLTFNCTTSLLPSALTVVDRHIDIRFCLNGYGDEMAWEFGWLKHKPEDKFLEYKARHFVNQYTDKMAPDADYSQVIRPAGKF